MPPRLRSNSNSVELSMQAKIQMTFKMITKVEQSKSSTRDHRRRQLVDLIDSFR